MKRLTSFGTFFIVILLTSSVFASGIALTGIGARATALGGNFRGIANDWSAMFWNPAGISQIKGMQFGFSSEILFLTGKYNFTQNNLMPFSVYRTTEVENEPLTYFIPSAGFVYGTEKLSFGLSIFAPFGLGAEWDAMNTAAYNDEYPEMEYDDNLTFIDIHPTFAFQVNDKLSIGLGFSFVLADVTLIMPKTTPNPLIFDPANAALKPLLDQFGLTTNTYSHILTQSKLEGDGTGFGLNFGIKYNVTDDLSFGLSGSWYNDISLDGKLAATTYYAKIDPNVMAQLDATLTGLIGLGQLTAEQKAQIMGVYSGQKVPTIPAGTKGDADLPLPMTVGGGIAYSGIDKLLISADISWSQWSKWDVIEIKLEDGSKQELVENWDDAIRFGVGFEYQLMDPLKIRAGYYNEPSAIPDETLSISIPDPGRRNAINLGLSYSFGAFDLFASYESILVGERGVEDWEYNTTAQSFDNMAGNYKLTVNTLMFGIGINF